MPAVLAFTVEVVKNPQMATYATFGGFANLVLVAFVGTRREKVLGHLGLGVAGSALLAVGTAVHGSVPVAAVVTVAVTFVVLMAGVIGPNVAAGGLAAMLAYILAAASPGAGSMLPDRLAGWWLGTAVAALAVAVMSPRRPGDQLRMAASAAAHALARETEALAAGSPDAALREASAQALDRLRTAFNSSPYRPTGLATVDQALGAMIELLGWVSDLVGDTFADAGEIGVLPRTEVDLLAGAGAVLEAVAAMLVGSDAVPDVDHLETLRQASIAALRRQGGDEERFVAAVHASFHARAVGVAVLGVAADALVASRQATPGAIAEKRAAWMQATSAADDGPSPSDPSVPGAAERSGRPAVSAGFSIDTPVSTLLRHASLRSVWTRNSARGAVAVAAAVVVADLTNVQHGFWVVLGTLSVLRTTATGTGGTALRGLAGTAIGVFVGAGIVVAVGTDVTVLWLVLPLAVLVAAYAPGVAPFAAGQAAFTAMLVVLYNLLLPVGWAVGVVRVEDIAAGCGISLVVGVLLWPRGATAVVVDDLSESFITAGRYLVEAVDSAVGTAAMTSGSRHAALTAGLRLEDALRAFLTEQGNKTVPKETLWALVGAAQRLRLTATAVADLAAPPTAAAAGAVLSDRARLLGDWYGTVATHVHEGRPAVLLALDPFPPGEDRLEPVGYLRACQTLVDQHLRHLHQHHGDVIAPAAALSSAARRPWWHPAATA